MFPMILIAIAAAAAFAFAHKSGAASALIVGHRYKIAFRTDVSRKAPVPFATLDALTKRLEALGWTNVFLEPSDADVDPFVWRASGTWSGALAKLTNGPGIAFIGTPTDVDAIPQQHLYDANLPADLELTVTRMLQSETDPNQLNTFAASLLPDFPIAAGQLQTKANALSFAPPSTPVTPTFLPPNQPTQPPVFIPPAPPPPISPDLPPVPQPTPPPPDPTPAFVIFDPGPLPRLPAIPPAGGNKTAAHASVQRALYNFYRNVNVLDPTTNDNWSFGPSDIDGLIGPKTQRAVWGFQRFQNGTNGMVLVEDGLPGASTNLILQQFGFDPNASTQPSSFTENDA